MDRATFIESCGVADLITTYYGGRNWKCAEAFSCSTNPHLNAKDCTQLWETIKTDLLHGQKLQGTLATDDVYQALHHHHITDKF